MLVTVSFQKTALANRTMTLKYMELIKLNTPEFERVLSRYYKLDIFVHEAISVSVAKVAVQFLSKHSFFELS